MGQELIHWVQKIIFLAMFLTMLLHILPGEKWKKYISFFAGLIFVTALIQPLGSLLGQEDLGLTGMAEVTFETKRQIAGLDQEYLGAEAQQQYGRSITLAGKELAEQLADSMDLEVRDVVVSLNADGKHVEKMQVTLRGATDRQKTEYQKKLAEILKLAGDKVEVSSG